MDPIYCQRINQKFLDGLTKRLINMIECKGSRYTLTRSKRRWSNRKSQQRKICKMHKTILQM